MKTYHTWFACSLMFISANGSLLMSSLVIVVTAWPKLGQFLIWSIELFIYELFSVTRYPFSGSCYVWQPLLASFTNMVQKGLVQLASSGSKTKWLETLDYWSCGLPHRSVQLIATQRTLHESWQGKCPKLRHALSASDEFIPVTPVQRPYAPRIESFNAQCPTTDCK